MKSLKATSSGDCRRTEERKISPHPTLIQFSSANHFSVLLVRQTEQGPKSDGAFIYILLGVGNLSEISLLSNTFCCHFDFLKLCLKCSDAKYAFRIRAGTKCIYFVHLKSPKNLSEEAQFPIFHLDDLTLTKLSVMSRDNKWENCVNLPSRWSIWQPNFVKCTV